MPLSLTDVVDLEVRLHLDRDADSGALHARDRALGVLSEGDRATRLSAWLHALRASQAGRSPGEQLALAARVATAAMGLAGLVLGWGTAAALLAYDGQHPINVLPYLGVVVGLQAVAVTASVTGLAVSRIAPAVFDAVPLWDDLRFLGRALLRFVLDRVRRARHVTDEAASALGRLRGRHGLYAHVEAWIAFGLVQTFAIAFNLGVLANALRLVAFTDLTFGWGTTLQLGADALHQTLQLLALPWAALLPDAVPDADMVRVTQFSRMSRTFADPAGLLLAPAWWRFLVTATLMWGLIPRLLLDIVARIGLARARRHVPLDTPEIDRVLARLATPRVSARTEDDASAVPGLPPDPGSRDTAAAGPAVVVRWGDFPGDDDVLRAALSASVGAQATLVRRAGGRDYAVDLATLDALTRLPVGHRVVVVAEAFDEPDRALRRFLAQLREHIGASITVVVALIDDLDQPREPDPQDLTRWRSMLGMLADPYLDVLPVRGTP